MPGWRCFHRQFLPNHSPQFQNKTFLTIFTMLLTPGGSPPVVLFYLGLCGSVFPATSLPGPTGVWPASWARFTAAHAWSPSPSPSLNGIFPHLHVDLVGPLQYSNYFYYIFTIFDCTSKWMEAIPLSETSAQHAQKL
jgi:hypothetical protein